MLHAIRSCFQWVNCCSQNDELGSEEDLLKRQGLNVINYHSLSMEPSTSNDDREDELRDVAKDEFVEVSLDE